MKFLIALTQMDSDDLTYDEPLTYAIGGSHAEKFLIVERHYEWTEKYHLKYVPYLDENGEPQIKTVQERFYELPHNWHEEGKNHKQIDELGFTREIEREYQVIEFAELNDFLDWYATNNGHALSEELPFTPVNKDIDYWCVYLNVV